MRLVLLTMHILITEQLRLTCVAMDLNSIPIISFLGRRKRGGYAVTEGCQAIGPHRLKRRGLSLMPRHTLGSLGAQNKVIYLSK